MSKVEYVFETIEETSTCPKCNHEFVTSIHGPPKNCKDVMTEIIFRDRIRVFYFNNNRKGHMVDESGVSIVFDIPYRKHITKKTNITYKQWRNRWCK